jgi:TonB family protein
LTFDSQGNVIGHPSVGPWSLALFEIQKLKIEKNQIRFEGLRVGSLYDPETHAFKNVRFKDREKVRVTIVADTTAATADALDALINRVLPSKLTAADVPDYWRDFFDGKAQQFRPRMEYAGPIPGEQFEGDAVYSLGLSGVSPPKLMAKQEPDYSEQALSSQIQGTAIIKLIIDKTGVPRNLQVITPIGFGLDDRAVEAAQQWRFEPAKLKGVPVPVQTAIEVRFRASGVMRSVRVSRNQ